MAHAQLSAELLLTYGTPGFKSKVSGECDYNYLSNFENEPATNFSIGMGGALKLGWRLNNRISINVQGQYSVADANGDQWHGSSNPNIVYQPGIRHVRIFGGTRKRYTFMEGVQFYFRDRKLKLYGAVGIIQTQPGVLIYCHSVDTFGQGVHPYRNVRGFSTVHEYSGGLALGLYSGAGSSWDIYKGFGLTFEVGYSIIGWKPGKVYSETFFHDNTTINGYTKQVVHSSTDGRRRIVSCGGVFYAFGIRCDINTKRK